MHRCFAGVDAALRHHGQRLVFTAAPGGPDGENVHVPVLRSQPLEGYRSDDHVAVVRFCPFCGEQLRKKKGDQE